MENISIADPVLWYEGMPLVPHHFQQESLRYQANFQMYLQVSGGFNYGIMELDVDRLELAQNNFKINKIVAIMPDGMLIKTDAGKEELSYALDDPGTAEKQVMSVYISIPKVVGDNYLLGKYPRFKREDLQEVNDINTGMDPTGITRMVPNVLLSSDKDLNPNFVNFKVGQVRVENNLWIMDDYVPAFLRVTPSTPIYKICSELCFALRKKINYISEMIFAEGVDKEASFISEYFFYAQGLGMHLPLMEGLLSSEQAHPFQVYQALCLILGGSALLTKELVPPFPAQYRHEEILSAFLSVSTALTNTMNSVIDEKMDMGDFTLENGVYTANITKDSIDNNYIYIGVKRQPTSTEYAFLFWMKNAIICEAPNLELSLHNRVLGFKREQIDKTENILPTRGIYLFRITPEALKKDSFSLAIFNPDDTENAPPNVFLYLNKKKDKK